MSAEDAGGVVVEIGARLRAPETVTTLPLRSQSMVPVPGSGDDAVPPLRAVYGQILRDERQDQDLTLADVADVVGMSKQYLSEVERGRKEPSSEILRAVSDALGVSLEHLLMRSARKLGSYRRSARQGGVVPRVGLSAA